MGGRGVGCRGALGDLFFDHANHLLVRRPEGLRDADRVLNDLRDRGIPVAPFAVIEDPVAADHEVVGIAAGEGRHDLQLLAGGFAHTIAVGEIGARQSGQQRVPGAILDGQAEIAASLVQVEGAGLEDRLVLAPVEIPEAHEVIQQLIEVPVITGELLHRGDGSELRFQALVLGNELGKGIFGCAGQNLADAIPPKLRHRAAGQARRPTLIGAEFRQQFAPVRLGESILVAEQRLDRVVLELGDRVSPGRVHTLRQRQRSYGLHACQREPGNLRMGDGQILGRKGQVILFLPVKGVAGAGVESREPAAREIVIHLGLDRFHSGRGASSGIAQWQHRRVGFSLLMPIGEGLGVGKELIHLGLADAGLAAAIDVGAEAGNDIVDDLFGGIVLGRFRDDDAVAVQDRFHKLLGDLGSILDRDSGGIRLLQRRENLLRRGQQLLAFRRRVIEGGQRQRRRGLEQLVRILQAAPRPLGGGDHLRRPNAAVFVGVDQRQGGLIEFQTGGGAGQRDPKLLVELIQGHQIGPGVQPDLVKAAGTEELPDVVSAHNSVGGSCCKCDTCYTATNTLCILHQAGTNDNYQLLTRR